MGTIFNKAFLSDLAIVLVACACTVLTRALPFVLFGRSGSPGRGVLYLGRVLPPAGAGAGAVLPAHRSPMRQPRWASSTKTGSSRKAAACRISAS